MKTTRREFLNSSIAGAATVAWARPALSLGHTSRFADTVRAHSLCRDRAESLAHQQPGRDHDPLGRPAGLVLRQESDLAAAFAKRFPDAKLARSENEILEDEAIQLVVKRRNS